MINNDYNKVMIMANTDDAQEQQTNNNNKPVASLATSSAKISATNLASNKQSMASNDNQESAPLMRYFDFDECNYSYVLGYN